MTEPRPEEQSPTMPKSTNAERREGLPKRAYTPGELRQMAGVRFLSPDNVDPIDIQNELRVGLQSNKNEMRTNLDAVGTLLAQVSSDSRDAYYGDKDADVDAWVKKQAAWIAAEKPTTQPQASGYLKFVLGRWDLGNGTEQDVQVFYDKYLNGESKVNDFVRDIAGKYAGPNGRRDFLNEFAEAGDIFTWFGNNGEKFALRDRILAEITLQDQKARDELEKATLTSESIVFVEEDEKKVYANMAEINKPASWKNIERLATRPDIASTEELQRDLTAAMETLKNTTGVVDISIADSEGNRIPTIIIPDLHARRDMLYTILKQPSGIGNLTVYEAMQAGRINVVLLGDAIHSEREDHWIQIDEFLSYDKDQFGRVKIGKDGKKVLTNFGELLKKRDTLFRIQTIGKKLSDLRTQAVKDKRAEVISEIDTIVSRYNHGENIEELLDNSAILSSFRNEEIIENGPGGVVKKIKRERIYGPAGGEDLYINNFVQLEKDINNLNQQIAKSKGNAEAASRRMMDAEMRDNLGIMQMIWRLQASYPKNFVLLLGTHDALGDLSAIKFRNVHQTILANQWVAQNRPQILEQWKIYSRMLPIDVRGKNQQSGVHEMDVLHTLPSEEHTLQELEDRPWSVANDLIYGTGDREYILSSDAYNVNAATALRDNLGFPADKRSIFFVGHTEPKDGMGNVMKYAKHTYGIGNNMEVITIDDGENYVYAIFNGAEQFDPERDVIRINPTTLNYS